MISPRKLVRRKGSSRTCPQNPKLKTVKTQPTLKTARFEQTTSGEGGWESSMSSSNDEYTVPYKLPRASTLPILFQDSVQENIFHGFPLWHCRNVKLKQQYNAILRIDGCKLKKVVGCLVIGNGNFIKHAEDSVIFGPNKVKQSIGCLYEKRNCKIIKGKNNRTIDGALI